MASTVASCLSLAVTSFHRYLRQNCDRTVPCELGVGSCRLCPFDTRFQLSVSVLLSFWVAGALCLLVESSETVSVSPLASVTVADFSSGPSATE